MPLMQVETALEETASLAALRAHFRATSTTSMPIAGALTWGAVGVAALLLPQRSVGALALYIMPVIMPLAFILDRLRGRNLFASGSKNPLTRLFLVSIVGIGLMVPVVLLGAGAANDPTITVLGMAILAGVIWVPYGWAADDPIGLRLAILRAIGCYTAFTLAPQPYKGSAICALVVLTYIYALIFMRRAGA